MDDHSRAHVDDIAGSILDGADVDWPEVESDADDSDRDILRQLRLVSSVAAVHRGLAATRSVPTTHAIGLPFRWGPLDVIEHIGRGSFGDVYRAWDRQLDREVALKLLTESATAIDRPSDIVEEGRLLARVRHPNVVTIYGAARVDGRVGLWMEYVRGRTLEQRLASNGPLAPADVVSIGRDLCNALAAVHAAGLLHRDIKAHNVMVDESGRVVLMDFGTGREQRADVDEASDLTGTPLYLAPEVLDRQPARPRSDVYSLSVLLYHLLTGTYPVVGTTAADIRDKHRAADPVDLRHRRPDVSAALDRSIGRGLSTDPRRRYATAVELSTALAGSSTSRRRLFQISATALLLLAVWAGLWTAARRRTAFAREFSNPQDPGAASARSTAQMLPASTNSAWVAHQIVAGALARSIALSSDGRYGAFTYSPTGDLAVRDLQTGVDQLLTDGGGWWKEYSDRPVISPDGHHVAYVMYIDTDNTVELRVASFGPGAPTDRILMKTDQKEGAYEIAWMPDGTRLCIAFSRPDRTSELGLVSIADGSFRGLKSLEWRRPNRLSVSPDGRFVAYDVPADDAGSPRDIFVLALDGSGEIPIVQNPANDMEPVWSAEGSQLVFLSNRTGREALWAVHVTNGRAADAPRLVKDGVPASKLLGITPHGTLFYVTPGSNPANIFTIALDAGTRATPVALTERLITSNEGPTWSRDGALLAYYALTTGRDSLNGGAVPGTLVVRTASTGKERTVPLPPRTTARFGAGPKWFPDNSGVLIEVGDVEGRGFGLYRLTVSTGNTELLVHLPRDIWSYDLSADGRSIFYEILDDPVSRLIRFDIDAHRETVLREKPTGAFEDEVVALSVAPNGRAVAMTLIGGAVQVMPAAGGEPRDLFRPHERELGTGALRQGLTWSPDQQFVYFVRGDGTFWRVPSKGGPAQRVAMSFDGAIKSPSISPDGKPLVFSGRAAADAIPPTVWALDNVLSPR